MSDVEASVLLPDGALEGEVLVEVNCCADVFVGLLENADVPCEIVSVDERVKLIVDVTETGTASVELSNIDAVVFDSSTFVLDDLLGMTEGSVDVEEVEKVPFMAALDGVPSNILLF